MQAIPKFASDLQFWHLGNYIFQIWHCFILDDRLHKFSVTVFISSWLAFQPILCNKMDLRKHVLNVKD